MPRTRKKTAAAPTTDLSGDSYLPRYNRSDEYPAYRSTSMDKRDAILRGRERGSFDDVLGDAISDINRSRVSPTMMAIENESRTLNKMRELLDKWNLPVELDEIARYKVFDGLPLEKIAQKMGTSKQAIHRQIDQIRDRLFMDFIDDKSYGLDSIINTEARKTIKAKLDNSGSIYSQPACICGSPHFDQQVMPDKLICYVCRVCRAVYTDVEYTARCKAKLAGRMG